MLAQGIAGNLRQGALLTRNRTTRLRPVRGDLRCSGLAAACDRQRRCEAAVILKEPLHRTVRLSLLLNPMSLRPRIDRAEGQRERTFLTADQHRRLAALLGRGTVPGRDEQAAHHERLAHAIERQQRDAARMRVRSPDVVDGADHPD